MVNRSKLPDASGPDVKPIYHDGNLADNFGPRRIAQFKRVPVRDRQNVMVEVTQRLKLRPHASTDTLINEILAEQGW